MMHPPPGEATHLQLCQPWVNHAYEAKRLGPKGITVEKQFVERGRRLSRSRTAETRL